MTWFNQRFTVKCNSSQGSWLNTNPMLVIGALSVILSAAPLESPDSAISITYFKNTRYISDFLLLLILKHLFFYHSLIVTSCFCVMWPGFLGYPGTSLNVRVTALNCSYSFYYSLSKVQGKKLRKKLQTIIVILSCPKVLTPPYVGYVDFEFFCDCF